MPTVPPVQTDQFEQTAVRGDLDLAIMKSGLIVGALGPVSGDGSLIAGDRVKLDTSVTTPGTIRFIAAADGEEAFGAIKRTAKQASFVEGEQLEVTFQGGPVMYQVAGATVRPGFGVEMFEGFVREIAAAKQFGLALDFAVVDGLIRVITGFVPS